MNIYSEAFKEATKDLQERLRKFIAFFGFLPLAMMVIRLDALSPVFSSKMWIEYILLFFFYFMGILMLLSLRGLHQKLQKIASSDLSSSLSMDIYKILDSHIKSMKIRQMIFFGIFILLFILTSLSKIDETSIACSFEIFGIHECDYVYSLQFDYKAIFYALFVFFTVIFFVCIYYILMDMSFVPAYQVAIEAQI